MKRLSLLLLLFIVFSFVSCKKAEKSIPDSVSGYELEIKDENRSDDLYLLLLIDKTENGYKAHVSEPVELSSVTVNYYEGALTLVSGSVEIPLEEKASDGVSVVFKVLDLISDDDFEAGQEYDLSHYHIEFARSQLSGQVKFMLDDGIVKRTFILKTISDA
ncbi:MAG: hypothetical protein IKG80_07700 [Clostridia bacterium]|nr:hypothetical protein [Clostridia bacterium]